MRIDEIETTGDGELPWETTKLGSNPEIGGYSRLSGILSIDSKIGKFPYSYYGLSSGGRYSIFAVTRGDYYSRLPDQSEENIDPRSYYSIMNLRFKHPDVSTFPNLLPALGRFHDLIFQVSAVTTHPRLRGKGLAKQSYIMMADKNKIICSDQWQYPGGENIWHSLITLGTTGPTGGRAQFDGDNSIDSRYMVTMASSRGFLARDVLGGGWKQLVKPIVNRGTPRIPNRSVEFPHSVRSDWIWHNSDNNSVDSKANLLFFAKTNVMNSFIQDNNILLHDYSRQKQQYSRDGK